MKAIEAVHDRVWAITRESLETIQSIASRSNPSIEEVEARIGEKLDYAHRATVRDGVATIPVRGPIFRYANLFTAFSGATSIQRLSTDFRAALEDPEVSAILLNVDSPGGEANGNGELANMIFAARGAKPIVAYVGGMCCSAAYYLASAADRIVADPAAIVGSIGTLIGFERRGADEKEPLVVVSDQSPDKYHDPETVKGQMKYQALVNSMAQVFVEDVARFRGVSPEHVLAHYGRGGILVGRESLAAGLVDSIGSYEKLHTELAGPGPAKGKAKSTAPVAASKPKGPAMSEKNQGIQQDDTPDYKAMYEAEQKRRADAEATANAAEAKARDAIEAQFNASADAYVKSFSAGADAVFAPAESAERRAEFLQAVRDDNANPVEGKPRFRQEALERAHGARKPHGLLKDQANADPARKSRALNQDPANDPAEEDQDEAAEREKRRQQNIKAIERRQGKAG